MTFNHALKPSKPNIIFILADDLGWGDLSIDGQPNYTTPHLDQLAREGIRFSTAYSSSPVCTPTRIGFFTGRYPGRLPIGVREPLASFKQIGSSVGLPPEHPTIASLLQGNGYDTALIGKWHCGYLPQYSPLKSGFHEFFGVFSGAVDYFRHVDTDGNPDLWEADVPIEKIGYITDLLTERAIDFIQRQRNTPFYLSLHHTAPHWPWEGPDDITLSQALVGRDGLQNWKDTGTIASYAAVMERLDHSVGAVVQALEEADLAENTLVVFASDNGGDKHSNMGLFRGQKGSVYEGGIRVPTFMRWKGVIPAHQVSEQVMITSDITATLLAASHTQPDPNYPLDGENLLPIISGETPVHPRTLFWRYRGLRLPGSPPRPLQGAARQGTWKYVRVGNEEFLFDLSIDPAEQYDRQTDHPDILKEIRAAYQDWEAQLEPYPA